MSIKLKIISYHRLTPGQQEIFKSDHDSFTIGRNDENDWAIPDPQRFLSGVHCRVHTESGDYFLTDTSTNGVFLNGAESRVERNATVELNHQDQFRIGDYEFEVLIDDSTSARSDTEESDESPFDTEATFVGEDQSADDFEDDFDDPFSDPEPAKPPTGESDDDFEKDINTPLAHFDNTPMAANAVRIESLLDLDDLDENEDEQVSAESLRAKHNPLNDAFQPSKRVESQVKPAKSVEFDDSFGTEIPDDWDEATGMLKVPETDESPKQADPFESDADGIPDDWEDAQELFDDPAESSPPADNHKVGNAAPEGSAVEAAKAPPAVADPPEPAAAPTGASAGAAPVGTAADNQPRPGGALAAFIAGAGLKSEDLAGVDESVLFEQIGSIMAEFTDGLVQTLSGRTHIKSEFRLDQTMIRPVENNPLKFSTSKTTTLLQLLNQQDTAYTTGARAVKEGFDDVNAHQMAVVAGMEAALQDILRRFNPESLEKRLESDSFFDNILPGGKKAKYWEMFKLLFDQIAGEAEDDFQQLFGSKFSRAYEQQLDRLKNNH